MQEQGASGKPLNNGDMKYSVWNTSCPRHEVFSVEWSKDFENIDLYEDISKVTEEDILKLFGKPDVICCIQLPLSGDLTADRRRPGNGLQGI